MTFSLTSTSFTPGGAIPRTYTADGRDISPSLAWESPPVGTQSFALICDDPDAPMGTWVHWVIWNVPSPARGLNEAVQHIKTLADGSAQGKNDFGRIGYGGPSPPAGKPHRYFFHLYAVKEKLGLPAGASRGELERAMQGRVLATAELFGTYKR
ncbi:MAG TPA: YbhB/YbcL family Raf kinase inhibitor-like protein [Spirochaetia bacterium]|nr:YbhB/YbcL family Raf kinase inhibitor-like protein [Spirochaetia bacterium]